MYLFLNDIGIRAVTTAQLRTEYARGAEMTVRGEDRSVPKFPLLYWYGMP